MKTERVCFLILICLAILMSFIGKTKLPRDHFSQTPPHGMVLIESDSLMPYYISVMEEPNINWQIYTEWLKRVYADYPEIYEYAQPSDTSTGLWQYYNDPFLDKYFTHPAYQWYPVTGVSWNQVYQYMCWKTDRLNESILFESGVYAFKPNKLYGAGSENFNTEAYLNNQYDPYLNENKKGPLRDYRTKKDFRDVKVSDGLFFPQYRLPTEKEWEAAYAWSKDKKHIHEIEDALERKNFLNYWKDFCHLDLEYPSSGIYNRHTKLSNFTGGVSEWLLENETYQWVHWENNYELLLKNGWQAWSWIYYDNYGELREKDSMGRMWFEFVQVSNVNHPVYMGGPQLEFYKSRTLNHPNPYYRMDSITIDSTLKQKYYQWNRNSYGYPYDKNDFGSFLKYIQVDPAALTKDSVNPVEETYAVDSVNRKVKSGNFRNKTHDIEWRSQRLSTSLTGFRCVLPFTGIPVAKGRKVKWK